MALSTKKIKIIKHQFLNVNNFEVERIFDCSIYESFV